VVLYLPKAANFGWAVAPFDYSSRAAPTAGFKMTGSAAAVAAASYFGGQPSWSQAGGRRCS